MSQPAGPVADFAGILDGHTLWLAVPAAAGPLTLRDRETGEVHALAADDTDRRYTSTRADLLALPGAGDASYGVEAGGAPVRAPATAEGPTRTPVLGPVAFDLETADDATLTVVRSEAPAVAWLVGVHLDDDGAVTLRVVLPDGSPEPERLVILQDGERLARVPVTDGVATLTPDLVDTASDESCRFVVAAGRERWRLRRLRNDLARPQFSVQLPPLGDRLELAWAPSGDLRLRAVGSES